MLAFLLMLYLVPMIFISSYGPATIPAEQNTGNDSLVASDSWLEGWDNRKAINITGSSGADTNYPVNVTVERIGGEMQTNFRDIRFTENDGVTLLDYWLEDYKSIIEGYPFLAWFWVEVTDNLDSNQTIYMYYGNDEVSTTSNGDDTFLFFDDFEDNTFDKWETHESQWSVQDSETKYDSYAAYGDSAATGRGLIGNLTEKVEYSIMIHSWIRFQSDAGSEYPITAYEDDSTLIYALYSPDDDWSTYDGVDVKHYETATQAASIWYRCEIGFDFVGNEFYPYINRVLKTKQDMDSSDASTTVTDVRKFGSTLTTLSDMDQWLDNYYVRKWVVIEPIVDSFGEEETTGPPEWELIESVDLKFSVEIYAKTLDMLIIFLGLIMIPASTLYLAKGGKSEMSGDKLFFGLIAFAIGWALVIGGIYG